MAAFILDLTKASLPWWWPDDAPLLMPIERGKHGMDWDIIMAGLPGDLVDFFYDVAGVNGFNQGRDLPLGFNEADLQPGAVVREASE